MRKPVTKLAAIAMPIALSCTHAADAPALSPDATDAGVRSAVDAAIAANAMLAFAEPMMCR